MKALGDLPESKSSGTKRRLPQTGPGGATSYSQLEIEAMRPTNTPTKITDCYAVKTNASGSASLNVSRTNTTATATVTKCVQRDYWSFSADEFRNPDGSWKNSTPSWLMDQSDYLTEKASLPEPSFFGNERVRNDLLTALKRDTNSRLV